MNADGAAPRTGRLNGHAPVQQTVDPQVLTALLRHFEWSPVAGEPGLYDIWRPDENDDLEVLVPANATKQDFDGLLRRAWRTVVATYGKEAVELVQALNVRASAALETTQWKKESPVSAGLIAWEEGERLYAAARAQLVAAAKAAKETRRYHGNASAYIAKAFLDQSFMGQTDVGSFVITAYTPANQRFYLSRRSEQLHQTELQQSDSCSGKEIMDRFVSALTAVRACLDDYRTSPRLEPFLKAVDDGVSYELVKALSELATGGDAAIAISRYGQDLSRPPIEFPFDATDAPVLERVANIFAQDPDPIKATLVGEITLLSRSSETGEQVIRLNIEDGADIRKARVRLSDEQYQTAMEAHSRDARIRIIGQIEKEGKLYWLYNPTNLEILEPEDTPRQFGGSGPGFMFHSDDR